MKNTPLLTPREKEILELSLGGAGCQADRFSTGDQYEYGQKTPKPDSGKKRRQQYGQAGRNCRRKKINCLNSFP